MRLLKILGISTAAIAVLGLGAMIVIGKLAGGHDAMNAELSDLSDDNVDDEDGENA